MPFFSALQQGQAAIGAKVYRLTYDDRLGAFDTAGGANTWTLEQTDSGRVINVDYPWRRSGYDLVPIGTRLDAVPGLQGSPQFGTVDVWFYETASPTVGKYPEALFEFDLANVRGMLGDTLILNLTGFASGDNGSGAAGYGLAVSVWDDAYQQFVSVGTNTATSFAAGALSLQISSAFVTAS